MLWKSRQGTQFGTKEKSLDLGFIPGPENTKLSGLSFYMPYVGWIRILRPAAIEVFSLGTGEWRNKADPPIAFPLTPPEAIVEGSLHWVSRWDGLYHPVYLRIISFHLADEVFEEIPYAPCQSLVSRRYSLSVLNGCLTAAGLGETGQFDIWVMKQYNVEESWKKECSFVSSVPLGLTLNGNSSALSETVKVSKVVCVMKNGEILLKYTDTLPPQTLPAELGVTYYSETYLGSLISYAPIGNRFKTFNVNGLPDHFRAFPFLPSFFSG